MAKKRPRTPPRTPIQAPRQRQPSRAAGFSVDRRRWLLPALAGGSGVIALVIVVVFLATRGGGGGANAEQLARTLTAAGCTLQTFPEQGRNHLNDLNARPKSNSFPPTSGPHYFQPVVWGSYPTPVSELQAVHNLEHGGVVVQYGSKVPATTVAQLQDFYDSDPNGMLLAPLPALGNKIALTAWTHLGSCTRYDETAFKDFRDAYRYHGPERIPKQFLNPGQ